MDRLIRNHLSLIDRVSRLTGSPTQPTTKPICAIWRTQAISAICLLALTTPASARAATISVCASGCNQTTVAAAVAAANNGDTITIGAGTYPFNVEIGKSITLQGSGAGETILDGAGQGSTLIVDAGTTVNLLGVTVQGGGNNYTPGTAGIVAYGYLNVSDSVITANLVGIVNNGGVTKVVRSSISKNHGNDSGFGGGVANLSGETDLINSTVSTNSATEIGGIAVDGGLVSLLNSTVSGNSGVVANIGVITGAFLSVANSTVVGNSGSLTSMEFLQGSQVSFGNSILSSPAGESNCTGPALLSTGHNLSSDNSCGLADPTDINNNATINLGPLQVNAPGTTASHALLPGSSAIDAGNCANGFNLNDQRGVNRPQGPACDIGAYEVRTPIANDDAYAAFAGRTFVLSAPGVMVNDVSPEGFPISVYSATSPANGSISFVGNGALFYTPNSGFTGQDSVSYTLWDGVHTSAAATVTFNVTSSNTPPTVVPDSYTVVEGQVLTVNAAQGVLANDTDPDGDPLATLLRSAPTHGTLQYHLDGSFIYTPNRGFNGIDTFTYTASDGHSQSAATTVTITVMPNFGTITIALITQPQSSTAFSFTGTLGNFTLGGTNPSSKTFQVSGGTWSVTEVRPKPWLMSNIVCNVGPGVLVDLTRSNLQIALSDGASYTCTFVNQMPGQIVARAFNDLNGDGQRQFDEPWLRGWTMQVFLNPTVPVGSGVIGSSGTVSFSNLQANVYTVCEVPPAGWHSTNPPSINPMYGKPCITVNLNPGQKLPVQFGNVR